MCLLQQPASHTHLTLVDIEPQRLLLIWWSTHWQKRTGEQQLTKYGLITLAVPHHHRSIEETLHQSPANIHTVAQTTANMNDACLHNARTLSKTLENLSPRSQSVTRQLENILYTQGVQDIFSTFSSLQFHFLKFIHHIIIDIATRTIIML